MTQEMIVQLLTNTVMLALIIAAPFLIVTLLVGLLISIFQAVTSINEMTLTFIPKILGVVILALLLFPWIMNQMIGFTNEIFDLIKTIAK